MNGLENNSDESVLQIRENLWNGIAVIGQRLIEGTADERENEKSLTPREFAANLTLPLFFVVNEECVRRGFEDYTGRLS